MPNRRGVRPGRHLAARLALRHPRFDEVVPILAAAGYRVIVPYLRGYGTTRFLSADTPRNGQQSALASDVIALMDALGIQSAVLAGFDWGARTACIVAALWPERCRALVSVSGYLIGNQEAGKAPLPPRAELSWWYQFYFATAAGRAGYEANRTGVRQADLADGVAAMAVRRSHIRAQRQAFDNPDHVDIVDPQLPLAARPRRGRAALRHARSAAGAGARHHACRRSRWRATRTGLRIRSRPPMPASSRQVRASADPGRHRPQPSPGGAERVRPGDPRSRGQDDGGSWDIASRLLVVATSLSGCGGAARRAAAADTSRRRRGVADLRRDDPRGLSDMAVDRRRAGNRRARRVARRRGQRHGSARPIEAGTLPFPDGTILVKLAWKRQPSAEFAPAFVPGAPTTVQVMVKDAKRYAGHRRLGLRPLRQGSARGRGAASHLLRLPQRQRAGPRLRVHPAGAMILEDLAG